MKRILISILLLLSIASFAHPRKKKVKKQVHTITKVTFETFTRRGRTEVTVTKDSAISIGRNESKFILLPAGEWTKVVNSLKKVKLSEIPTWESPTKAREYDGAAHCQIVVCTKSKRYESQSFDGGHPMKQLQALYDVVQNFRNDIDTNGQEYAVKAE